MPDLARTISPHTRDSIRTGWVCLLTLLVLPGRLHAHSVGGNETVAAGTVSLLIVSLVGLVVLRARVRRQTALARAAVDAEAEMAQRHRDLIESANDVIFR